MNSTLYSTSPGTYWEQYEDVSRHNAHLNVVERLWSAWYAWMQNDVLATGIMSFVMHEIVYFGRSLPWIFIDTLGLFKNYKIQNNKIPSLREQWDCAKFVLLSHFTVELPQIWLVSQFTQAPCLFLTVCPQAFPPHGSVLRSVYVGSFSLCLDHDVPDRHFLCS
jgi:methylsterol monooxygenase